MSVNRIDELIETATRAINAELDMNTVYRWKKQAFDFLAQNLGPDHYYTQYFKNYIDELEQRNLLTGSGILAAAKEEIRQKSDNS